MLQWRFSSHVVSRRAHERAVGAGGCRRSAPCVGDAAAACSLMRALVLTAQTTRQGSGFLEGLRRGLPPDAHVLQPRRPLLPLPRAVDRLQPRRRAWAAQDPNLQGAFCSSISSCGVAWCSGFDAVLCCASAVVLKQTLLCRFMWMGVPPCPRMRGKQASGNFMASVLLQQLGDKKNICL